MASIDFCDCELEEDSLEAADYNPDLERQLLLFATSFVGELKYIAKKYMVDFFAQQSFHQGGKIPYALLNDNSNLSMVINYDIIRGVDLAYHSLKTHDVSQDYTDSQEDIRLVVDILNKLSAANIPQQFAGGMILLYLKFVEGVHIG
jgi:hypothetical protein